MTSNDKHFLQKILSSVFTKILVNWRRLFQMMHHHEYFYIMKWEQSILEYKTEYVILFISRLVFLLVMHIKMFSRGIKKKNQDD